MPSGTKALVLCTSQSWTMQATSQLILPYPCQPLHRYETSNHLWLILEYCVGGDLMSLLRQDMLLPESSIHDFGRDLVISIQYLHSNAIIYCDLKPSNILLDENGRIKLGGFGLSRRLSDINKTSLQQLPPVRASSMLQAMHVRQGLCFTMQTQNAGSFIMMACLHAKCRHPWLCTVMQLHAYQL